MKPDKLAKIRALAADKRGDPATRQVAIEILKRYEAFVDDEPTWTPPPKNPSGPGNTFDYEKQAFMSLRDWKRSTAGNFVHTCTFKGRAYRVVIFKHKKTPTYGWLRVDIMRDEEVWSGRFRDIQEAHQDAWKNLQSL